MAYWVQKTQATNYLGAFHYNHLGLQGKLGPLRLNPRPSPDRPMLCPSAASQIRLLQVWEMKQEGQHVPDNRYTVTLAWGFISHLTKFLTIHPEHGTTVQEL